MIIGLCFLTITSHLILTRPSGANKEIKKTDSTYKNKLFYLQGSSSLFSNEQRDQGLKRHGAKLATSLDDDVDYFVFLSGKEPSAKIIGDKEVFDAMAFVENLLFEYPELTDPEVYPELTDSDANVFYMKNGQELLDALESVLGWADQWEDLFKWIAMGKNTDYDEDELMSPVKTSWCQLKKYKDLWGIEVRTGGKSRSGAGWFDDDLEIKKF